MNVSRHDDVINTRHEIVMTTDSGLFARHTLVELYEVYRPSIVAEDKYVTPVWYVIGFPW